MKGKRWTKEEIQFLIDKAGKLTDKEFSFFLDRTVRAIQFKRISLGLPAPKARYEVFKGYELIAEGTVEECAEELGLKESTIRYYACQKHWRRLDDLDSGITAMRVN